MIRLISVMGVAALMSTGCSKPAEHEHLDIYITAKGAGEGLHEANYPALPNLGYIASKPDLTISQLNGVSFGRGRVNPNGAPVGQQAPEDRHALVLELTKEDAATLQDLTSRHLGNRMLMLLNGEPLFAPLLQTPSIGQSVYIVPPASTDTPKLKARLEKLVHKPK